MTVCTLLYLGYLCISPVSGGPAHFVGGTVSLKSWGDWPTSGVRLKAPGWEAVVVNGTDNPPIVNARVFSKVCEGAFCIRYHAHCVTEVDQKRRCAFSILRNGRHQPVEIDIVADGEDGEQAALRSVSFITENGARIPLEAMSVRSLTDSPYCKRIGRSEKGAVYEPACAYLNP